MTYYSTYPKVEIPNCSVYDYIFSSLNEEELNRVAATDGEKQITYAELRGRIDAFAGALAQQGVNVGDVVALHAPNCIAFMIAFHGILRAGATATTLNVLYSPSEIANQLNDSKAKLCITISMFLPNVLAGIADTALEKEQVIVLDGAEGHLSMLAMLSAGQTPPDVQFDATTHLAVLPYSSGTTGKAKGVMLSHYNLVANIAQSAAMLPIGQDDVTLAVLPFFHIYGMNVIMNITLYQRGKLVIMPKFDLPNFLQLIQNQKCSCVFIAPPIAVALTKVPLVKQFDLSSIRLIVSGAAPMDEALGAALVEQIPCHLLQGFGMTELSPVSHVTPLNSPHVPYGSIGVAVPNVSFKVVDPVTGIEVEKVPNGRTTAGEMLVHSPSRMLGYLNNQAATDATITADGFLHTGDIVEVGPHGEVYVVDRLKELIKYKGFQVPPAELEALLLTHPAIADSAVVAHPDEDAGEIPRAFVVLQADATVSKDEIMSYVAAKVASHKQIRIVDFIDAIPKSMSGKILRKDLKGRPL